MFIGRRPGTAPLRVREGAVRGSQGRQRFDRVFAYGLLAGFTTMVANAGGAVMSLYLLAAGYAMLTFLGTAAWFFLIVNVFKVPFSAGLGLITVDSLVLNAVLLPALFLGAFLGRAGVKRLDQAKFSRLVLVFTVVASVNLLR